MACLVGAVAVGEDKVWVERGESGTGVLEIANRMVFFKSRNQKQSPS